MTEKLKLKKLELEVQKAQSEAETARFEALHAMFRLRPCHLYAVRIYHNDVTWVCEAVSCGDAVGCGDSPKAAQIAFDNMWMGTNDAGLDG